MIPICQLLPLTKLCGGSTDVPTSDCELLVGEPRPLFCDSCDMPTVPYNCFALNTLPPSTDELLDVHSIIDVTHLNDVISLAPGRAILHQWTALDETSWYAGLAAATGDQLILWKPGEDYPVNIPQGSALENFIATRPYNHTKVKAEEHDKMYAAVHRMKRQKREQQIADILELSSSTAAMSTSRETQNSTRGSSTFDLLYMLDKSNHLRVDAWKAGIYQGYSISQLKTSTHLWEPVLVNISQEPAKVFFATTEWQDMSELQNLFRSN